MRRPVLALVVLLAMPAMAFSLDESKVVDLTYPFNAETIYWPTEEGFRLEREHYGRTEAGYFYSSNKLCTAEHGGTHVDAPVHFSEGKLTIDALPVSALIGPAVVVDVRTQAAADRDYRLAVADLEAWETAHGRIPDGAIVLMYSGWGRFWPDKQRYLGTAQKGDLANLHFPGFSREAAEWLVRERVIDAIGVDTPSLDHGQSKDFIVHQRINGANKPGVENVANLDRLPPAGATLIVLPMKIGGGSGAPARVIALLP